jgi:hypothetical protein
MRRVYCISNAVGQISRVRTVAYDAVRLNQEVEGDSP